MSKAMEPARGYYNTFVVKIWQSEVEGTMRGYIQHVSTQEQAHFFGLGNMSNFILNHLGPPAGDSISQDKIRSEATLPTRDVEDVEDE
ncbi:MAG: hypothetical protein R6U93_05440 [Dehalococcoidia bacterium]